MGAQGGGLLVFVGLVAVAAVASRRGRVVRLGQLGRLLFPSWRLFDHDATPPRLYLRQGESPGELGPWRELEKLDSSVPFDPRRSRQWGVRSLLAQLAGAVDDTDPGAPEDLAQTVPYRLVKALAARKARAPRFQFKLCGDEDIVVSPIYSRAAARQADSVPRGLEQR